MDTLKHLEILYKMNRLARKIEKDNMSVRECETVIENLSRFERSLCVYFLKSEFKRKMSWGLGNVLKKRRRNLACSIEEGCADEFLRGLDVFSQLELLESGDTVTNDAIRENIVNTLEADETVYNDFSIYVDGFKYRTLNVDRFFHGMRRVEKRTILKIICDVQFDSPIDFLYRLPKYYNLLLSMQSSEIRETVAYIIYKALNENSNFEKNALHDEFSIDPEKTYEDVTMNCDSCMLMADSVLVDNPSTTFMVSLFNCFQNLEISGGKSGDKVYNSYSHSITTFCLRKLEKAGAIKILKQRNSDCEFLGSFYSLLGNTSRDRPLKMYDVKFIKLRNLDFKDLEWLKQIFMLLKISMDGVEFSITGGKLKANVKPSVMIGNMLSCQYRRNIKRLVGDLELEESEKRVSLK